MSIHNISTQGTYAANFQLKQQNWNKLFSALKAGDLATAQNAYAALGLPPIAKSNASPMGRMYQALHSEDLAAAQKAALDMQPKNSNKAMSSTAPASTSSTPPSVQSNAAAALVSASKTAQQSSLLKFMGLGNHVNTAA
jgi:hypothetical protein